MTAKYTASALKELKTRLLRKVKKTPTCWLWLGALSDGYGSMSWKGKTFRTNRVSFTVFKGEIPEGLFICHSCDKRSCVNPGHLWLGTNKENMQDCGKKGRHGLQKDRDAAKRFSDIGCKARLLKKKDSCFRGHPYDKENTIIRRSGGRDCKMCHKLRYRSAIEEKNV